MIARLAHHLDGCLGEPDQTRGANRIRRQHTARRVQRDPPTDLGFARFGELPSLAFGREAMGMGDVDLMFGVGAVIGAATLMLLQKVLFSGGVSSFYTGIFQGAVMVLAIVFGSVISRLASAGARA